MKRILIISITVVMLSSIIAFAIPALAHNPTEENATQSSEETWETMHEACEEGNWEAMAEAAQDIHEDYGYTFCHDDEYPGSEENNIDSWGGTMGGHMVGWGGMMGR